MNNCVYCSFETIEAKEKEDHVSKAHANIDCDKYDYITLYASIMKKHMNTTTGTSIFNCRTCEFESTHTRKAFKIKAYN